MKKGRQLSAFLVSVRAQQSLNYFTVSNITRACAAQNGGRLHQRAARGRYRHRGHVHGVVTLPRKPRAGRLRR